MAGAYRAPMTDDDTPYPEPPAAGDEVATLLGSLERQRATFAWKCGGLDEPGLRATVGASSMTLGGLLKHVAFVEDYTFSTKLLGRPPRGALGVGGLGRRARLGVALGRRRLARGPVGLVAGGGRAVTGHRG